MGNPTAAAAAGAVAVHDDKPKAGRREDPPIKVHSRWHFTHTTYWVDLDDLFQRPRVRKALEDLEKMYKQGSASSGP